MSERLPSQIPEFTPAAGRPWLWRHVLLLLLFWVAIFVASLCKPPLLDDADATHAQAAQAMLSSSDWVTLHVDGVRYLEKPPLPYWITAIDIRLFGANAFAIHLPLALASLGLALLGYGWSRRVFGERTALYAGIFTLTAAGVFLFTRIFIPDVLLSLFLCAGLYGLLRALDPPPATPAARYAFGFWVAMALAVLSKGLVAIAFLVGTALLFLAVTRGFRHWRRLRPSSGCLLFLAIAAPWHILAGLRNTGGADGHGFFWFYFINEHVLRFLGRRIPRDYNKLPSYLYWSLHLVWLFPWSLFAPVALIEGWRRRRTLLRPSTEVQRTIVLLCLFSALVLVFFSLSTNQEYYTFPVYLPLLMLLAFGLVRAEREFAMDRTLRRWLLVSQAVFSIVGVLIAAALAYGLWASRHLPFTPDIGALLAHRDVGGYTLSMSHFFDLTGPSFAALRLPAVLAAIAFVLGPQIAWWLRVQRRHFGATLSVGLTSAVFLVAAHLALMRFAPMLSSESFAQTILNVEHEDPVAAPDQVLIYGDQAFGSSLIFYLHRRVDLVDGRTTSMLFGSTFSDAPPIFLTSAQLVSQWGRGPRKFLFVPLGQRNAVDDLLGPHQIVLQETSGKALLTDRPLSPPPLSPTQLQSH